MPAVKSNTGARALTLADYEGNMFSVELCASRPRMSVSSGFSQLPDHINAAFRGVWKKVCCSPSDSSVAERNIRVRLPAAKRRVNFLPLPVFKSLL